MDANTSTIDKALEEKKAKKKRHDHDVKAFKKAKKYYDIRKRLLKLDCQYYFCYGMRSNGKSYSSLNYCLEDFKKRGRTFCYIRRWQADTSTKNMQHLLDPQPIKEIFGSQYRLRYWRGAFELVNEVDPDETPIQIGFARNIGDVTHDKSIELPHLGTIVFDEFLPMQHEIGRIDKDEVKSFINAVTTLTRVYGDIKVLMLGNTTTLASGYFNYFDIPVATIAQGELRQIDVPVRNSKGAVCKVAVEYCEFMPEIAALTGIYAPKEDMITQGAWEKSKLIKPPEMPSEEHTDTLLCSMNDPITGRTVGIFVRKSHWITSEFIYDFRKYYDHVREFLVVKLDSPISSYWHLTNIKDLTYSTYTNWQTMVDDILDQTEIDIINELSMNRVYAEDDDAGDRLNYCLKEYASKSIIDLLKGENYY